MKTLSSDSSRRVSLTQIVSWSLVCTGAALLTGCGSYPEEHVVSAPPPAVVTQPTTQQVVVSQPGVAATVVTATPLANGTIIVTQAPPVAQQAVVEARPARPSSSHVWIDGYWTWRNSRYEWIGAHWQEAPYSNARWVSPRWEQRSDGNYTFYEGYWN